MESFIISAEPVLTTVFLLLDMEPQKVYSGILITGSSKTPGVQDGEKKDTSEFLENKEQKGQVFAVFNHNHHILPSEQNLSSINKITKHNICF